MPSRWLRFAALAAAAAALAGCGSVVSASETTGNQLTVYSSLPLEGPSAEIARQIEGGEKLALAQAGGHVGAFRVSYVSLDDVNPLTGKTSPGESSTAAKQAAQDTSTIAYLGDYGSQATAVTLPLINEAGILQVSPASPYVGLTSSEDAGQDEPDRFYPSGKRTFVRLQGGDPVQAGAQAQLMGMLNLQQRLRDRRPGPVRGAARLARGQARGTGRREGGRPRQHRLEPRRRTTRARSRRCARAARRPCSWPAARTRARRRC